VLTLKAVVIVTMAILGGGLACWYRDVQTLHAYFPFIIAGGVILGAGVGRAVYLIIER